TAIDLAATPGVSFATFSAHKIGGPKGVGALIAAGGLQGLSPLVRGKQQRGARGGTENSLGVALTGRALQLDLERPAFPRERLMKLRDDFERELKAAIPGTVI